MWEVPPGNNYRAFVDHVEPLSLANLVHLCQELVAFLTD
jgi:hypothetical protein